MALEDTALIVALSVVAAIAITACIALVLLMQRRNKTPATVKPKESQLDQSLLGSLAPSSPFKVMKSVQLNDAAQAKNELRILDLEREILADAIRKLYEANAEGKITELERERLAGSYKSRMMAVKDAMTKDESIVALHELESMQEDLMKLFSERFGELTGKVEELRTRIDIKPIKEIKVQMPKPQAPVPEQLEKDEDEEPEPTSDAQAEKEPKKPRKTPVERQKTEAEQRIDAIRNQIDEVMNKLGQMEMET
jgi:hypothetical protein